MAPVENSKHLSLIDAGVSNIWSLSLPGHLENINLHGNYIRHISNLSHLSRLQHLDLSANQISVIDGLDKLVCLRTLNLSCNFITSIEGLSGLKSLERLNLSYNQIDNAHGLIAFSGPDYCLSFLALHGNKLQNVHHLTHSLTGITTLKHLVLSQDGSANPFCNSIGYEALIRSQLPRLETLNGLDKTGRLKEDVDSLTNIPGLDAYLDFLLSEDKEHESDQPAAPKVPLITPKIDAVMEQFKIRVQQESSTSSLEFPSHKSYEQCLPKNKTLNQRKSRSVAFVDRECPGKESQSSGDEDEPVQDFQPRRSKKDNTAFVKSSDKERQPRKTHPTGVMSSSTKSTNFSNRGKQKLNQQQLPTQSSIQKEENRKQYEIDSCKRHKFPQAGKHRMTEYTEHGSFEGGDDRKNTSTIDADSMYKELLVNLENERERRWKAEEAARRMAESLKDLQLKGKEAEDIKKHALEATTQIKQAMMNEHEANKELQTEIKKLQEELKECQDRLFVSQRAEERSREALKEAESTLGKKEGEELVARIHHSKAFQEVEERASNLVREVETLRLQADSSSRQLRQVQETLAVRENQHRQELRHRYSLNSPELKEVIENKVKDVERSYQADLVRQQEKAEKLGQQYNDLEDEFRFALHTEEARFREIKTELEQIRCENVDNKQLLLVAQQKDESSTAMITELSQLVKEQKGRITELCKSKNEHIAEYKERVNSFEDALTESRKQSTQLELLKQSKSRLQATVQAQESVIEGLKAERKLWGQELAQQGASLSQDRGRLESKIEMLQTEISSLKKQLEREADAVKIKTKMVEDQTETIRKLKEGLVERDDVLKKTRDESLEVQRSLEEQLTDHKAAVDESRDIIDRATSRKDELKQQVAELQAELKETKEGHNILSSRWKEKTALIGKLEEQVNQMKASWTKKELTLQEERDAALSEASQAMDKLKTADSAFRKQIDLKEAAMQEKINKLEIEKQQEVELANKKVALVEDEMREMLRENDTAKRAMETKMKKLNQALVDLQTDLT